MSCQHQLYDLYFEAYICWKKNARRIYNFISYVSVFNKGILCGALRYYILKQGPIRHKLWHIQKLKDWQDNCRLLRQLKTVKTIADCQDLKAHVPR